MRKIPLYMLLVFCSVNLCAQQYNYDSTIAKLRRTAIDSLDRESYYMLQRYFDDQNLKEALPAFQSIAPIQDSNVVWHKRTMSIAELRTMPHGLIDWSTTYYSVYNQAENWRHEDLYQFDELPYYPGEKEPVALFRELCNQITSGQIIACHDFNTPYSIDEFKQTFFYYEVGHLDSSNTLVWNKQYWDSLPYADETRVYKYIVIEDWVCYSDLRFESKVIAIAPLKQVYADVSISYHCFFDQVLLFWIFFK